MIYLSLNDFYALIKPDVLGRIATSDEIDEAELAVIAEVEAFLSNRYDMGQVWNDTQERNRLLVMLMVDMSLYHLHSRLNPGAVPEIRQLRYEQALDILKKIASGQLSLSLPLRDESPKPFFLGSEKRRAL